MESSNIAAMTIIQLIHIASIVLTGLVTGLLYGYACSVTGGLGKLSDEAFLSAFQSINKAILNPWFFLSFMGCLVVLPITDWLLYKEDARISFYWLLAATIFYIIGVFGITIFGNVPLNDTLSKVDLSAISKDELGELRKLFETPWNKYHLIRTIAAFLSFLMAIISLVKLK